MSSWILTNSYIYKTAFFTLPILLMSSTFGNNNSLNPHLNPKWFVLTHVFNSKVDQELEHHLNQILPMIQLQQQVRGNDTNNSILCVKTNITSFNVHSHLVLPLERIPNGQKDLHSIGKTFLVLDVLTQSKYSGSSWEMKGHITHSF